MKRAVRQLWEVLKMELTGKSDRAVIILHEIYGINSHIKSECSKYFERGFDIICPNFLTDREKFEYSEEKEAYTNFVNSIGFEKMSQEIEKIVEMNRKKYNKIFLIGFSVGATAAWLCSSKVRIDGVLCFYGSRIRDYLEFEPKSETVLIYPEKEESFSVKELIEKTAEYVNVRSYILEGNHGFADKYSMKYNKKSAEESEKIVMEFLKEKIN